mmetsp:Transcript_19238/g.33930  ORF Transcript_19238/g.33930 Transcript_19238/m.33930 type:complete len:118 (-) Transcript_19238:4140-4493(-)
MCLAASITYTCACCHPAATAPPAALGSAMADPIPKLPIASCPGAPKGFFGNIPGPSKRSRDHHVTCMCKQDHRFVLCHYEISPPNSEHYPSYSLHALQMPDTQMRSGCATGQGLQRS